MEYKGVKIELKEYVPGQKIPEIGAELAGGFAFVASSVYGVAIANRSDRALADAKAMVDRALSLN